MSFSKLLGIAGGAGQAISTATTASILAGAIFTLDCRILAGRNHDRALSCYLTGFPVMGIGLAGKAGYNTFNPRLHPPSGEKRPRGDREPMAKRKREDDEQY